MGDHSGRVNPTRRKTKQRQRGRPPRELRLMCTGRSFERLGNGSPRGMIAPQVSARGTGLGLQPTHRVLDSAPCGAEILPFGGLETAPCAIGFVGLAWRLAPARGLLFAPAMVSLRLWRGDCDSDSAAGAETVFLIPPLARRRSSSLGGLDPELDPERSGIGFVVGAGSRLQRRGGSCA